VKESAYLFIYPRASLPYVQRRSLLEITQVIDQNTIQPIILASKSEPSIRGAQSEERIIIAICKILKWKKFILNLIKKIIPVN